MVRATKTDAALAAAAEAHADDPERAELLHCARRFKSSWLELGEALTSVRKSGAWKRWGYEECFVKLIPLKVAKASQQQGVVAPQLAQIVAE